MSALSSFFFGGREVPVELVGRLRDSSPLLGEQHRGPSPDHLPAGDGGSSLRGRLAADGYVFLPNVLDKDDVLAAREEVFARLVEVGEIKQPAMAGIATGRSRRTELTGDLVAFWRSVSEGTALRRVSHGPAVRSLVDLLCGEPARPQDYLWLRPRPVGWTTDLHFDRPFFVRGDGRVYTVWIALGDIPLSDGPLALVEGSHRFLDLIELLRGTSEQVHDSPEAELQAAFHQTWTQDALALVEQRGARLLSEDFSAGDLVVFGMDTLHGALDNRSSAGRVRLSCDVRYQPATQPLDDRYFGPHPRGQKGAGYGDMSSARPLNVVNR